MMKMNGRIMPWPIVQIIYHFVFSMKNTNRARAPTVDIQVLTKEHKVMDLISFWFHLLDKFDSEKKKMKREK